jgi:hypothetical protein
MYMGAYAYINRNLMDVEFVHILRKMLIDIFVEVLRVIERNIPNNNF